MMNVGRDNIIRVYSRDVIEGEYPNGLAFSVHMSITSEGSSYELNNNYGMLFPCGGISSVNTIVPHFMRNIGIDEIIPTEDKENKEYLITGRDVDEAGIQKPENEDKLWAFSTTDFIDFEEIGLVSKEFLSERFSIDGEKLGQEETVALSKEQVDRILTRWMPLKCTSVTKSDDDPNVITVTYSDGSKHKKRIDNYPDLRFPLAKGFGDPVIFLWKDEYYYIATNDNVNDIGFYVRKASEINDLFSDKAQTSVILDRDEKRHLIQTFWAPEFHVINDKLYILFAVSGEQWGPQCHYMKLKENGDILNPLDWEDPVRIKGPDGQFLCTDGITLDMTTVKSGSRHYYVWSYRQNIGSPLDSGSMLMVAEFDPSNPEKIITEPQCISRPLYGFENVCGTINNEGPYAFYHDGTIYLAYSGGDARGYLYTVGMLTAKDGDDLCDLSVWNKAKTPILSFASIEGEFGPGHNSFFKDRNNDWWIAYHAVDSYGERKIADGFRRIHFDVNNKPRFDVALAEDLPYEFRVKK